MRSLLSGELAQAQSFDSAYYVKLEVKNASGTWKDVGALLGSYWIVNASWGENRDTQVSGATFTLIRNIGSASLAPLMTGSALNVDDALLYAPLLNIGRAIRASTATMPWGVALDPARYRLMFTGRIDDVLVQDDGEGRANIISLPCSDLGAWLMDLQIETSGTQYGNPVTPPTLESVLQAVINANIPVGEPAVALVKQSASSFGVTDYKQGDTKLLEGLTTLVLDSVGEDLRYRFDAAHVSQLMWFNPDRARVTIDATFAAQQYVMRRVELSLKDIRNAGELSYTAGGVSGVVTAVDAASISDYRRRWFRLPFSQMLSTQAEAQSVINIVVNDLGGPPAEAQAELPFCWFVQLYDRYTFVANGKTYDQDQTFTVGGYQHTIENGRGSTVLTPLTARIVGAYATWQKKIGGATPAVPAPPVLSASFDATGQLIINSSGDAGTTSQKIAWATGAAPSAATVRATTAIAQQNVSGLATGSVYPAGTTVYIAAFAYSANGLESTPLAAISVTREGSGTSAPPVALITPLNTEVDDTVWNLRFDATAGSGGGGTNLTYDIRIKIGFAAETSLFSGNATTLPKDLGVSRHFRSSKAIRFIVTDTATGLKSIATFPVPSQRPEVNDSGNIDDQRNMSSGVRPFRRALDLASDVVEIASRWFTDSAMLDVSRRITSVYRSATTEPVLNLFKRGSDLASDIVESTGRWFTNNTMLDASRNVVNVFRSAATEPVSNLFKRGVDTADDVTDSGTKRVIPFSVIRTSDNQLMTGLNNAATVGDSMTARANVAQSGRYFNENYDVLPSDWPLNATAATISLVGGVAKVGTKVLQVVGYDWRYWPTQIPLNPTKLYRFRARFRQTVDPTVGAAGFYLGVRTYDASGTYVGDIYCVAAGAVITVAGGWQEITGWVKGSTAFSAHFSADPTAPVTFGLNAVTMQPLSICNYVGGNGTTQIDYIQIDEFDEDASDRTYSVIGTGQTFKPAAKDSRSAPVNNMFRHSVDDAAGVLVTAVRTFIAPLMVDINLGVVNVFRSAATEPVSNLFKRGVDTSVDVVSTTGRGFIEQSGLDGSLRPTSVYRGAGYEPVSNLFKRGVDTLADVLDTGTRFASVAGEKAGGVIADFPSAVLNAAGWIDVTNGLPSPAPLAQFIQSSLPYNGPIRIDFDVYGTGPIILDLLLYAGSSGAAGVNGYMFRFDSRNAVNPGQILLVTNGVWSAIGTAKGALNPAALTGWHHVSAIYYATGHFDIFVDGVWQYTALDTTYTLNGVLGYGYELGATRIRSFRVSSDRAIPSANITNAGHLGSAVQDSRSAPVNNMFRSGVDTADGVMDSGTKRVTTLNEADGGGRGYGALELSSALKSTTQQRNGTGLKNVANGRYTTGLGVHGVSITYPTNYQNPPAINILGGISYQPASLWGTAANADAIPQTGTAAPNATAQIDEVVAYNITTSTANLRARLRQASASTGRTDAYAAGQITTNGGTKEATTANAPAANDTYTTDFTVQFTSSAIPGKACSVSGTVNLDYWNGSAWINVASSTYAADDPVNGAADTGLISAVLVASVSGLTITSKFRVRLVTNPGAGSRTYMVDPVNVAYTTTTGDQYTSKTPANLGITLSVEVIGAS